MSYAIGSWQEAAAKSIIDFIQDRFVSYPPEDPFDLERITRLIDVHWRTWPSYEEKK